MRRLIVLAVEEGSDVEIEYEGEFAYWEVLGAIERAHELVEGNKFDDEIADAMEQGNDEGEDL